MDSVWKRIGGAFSRATGPRKYLLLSTPLGIAGIYKLLRVGLAGGNIFNLPDLPVWYIAGFAMLVLLALWFFQRIMELERTIEPNIEINFENTAPFVIVDPSTPGSMGNRFVRIEVENTGLSNLENCLVVLESITDQNGSPGFFTPVGLATQHQLLQKRRGGPFDLRGGEKKFVNIAALDETRADSEITLLYETATDECVDRRYPNGISRALAPYTLDLAVFGGACPIRKKFRLSVASNGALQMDEV